MPPWLLPLVISIRASAARCNASDQARQYFIAMPQSPGEEPAAFYNVDPHCRVPRRMSSRDHRGCLLARVSRSASALARHAYREGEATSILPLFRFHRRGCLREVHCSSMCWRINPSRLVPVAALSLMKETCKKFKN